MACLAGLKIFKFDENLIAGARVGHSVYATRLVGFIAGINEGLTSQAWVASFY